MPPKFYLPRRDRSPLDPAVDRIRPTPMTNASTERRVDRALTLLLVGAAIVSVLILAWREGMRESALQRREQRAAEQRKIAVLREKLKLPPEARVVAYESWHGVEERLSITLPTTRRPEDWVASIGKRLAIPDGPTVRREPLVWAGEYRGVAYVPETGRYYVRCF